MWKAEMNPEEKKAYLAAKAISQDTAVSKARGGDFPAGVRFKIGDHTLSSHPIGMSASGGVSYGISPSTVQVGKYRVRINKVSFTVLTDQEAVVIEGDMI